MMQDNIPFIQIYNYPLDPTIFYVHETIDISYVKIHPKDNVREFVHYYKNKFLTVPNISFSIL